MSDPLIVKNSIGINATPQSVWDALINPEQTQKIYVWLQNRFRLEAREFPAVERQL